MVITDRIDSRGGSSVNRPNKHSTDSRRSEKDLLPPGLAQRMQQVMSDKGASSQRLGQHILDNPRSIIHLSISELAQNAKASEATVVRFCQNLGFKGYQDFKIHLSQALVSPVQSLDAEITEDDRPGAILAKVARTLEQTLQDTTAVNLGEKEQNLDRGIELLYNARRILTFGTGGSGLIAQDAAYRWLKLGLHVQSFPEYHTARQATALLESQDLLVLVSHSGSTRDVVMLARLAQEQGVPVVAITRFGRSPLASGSQVVLCTSSPESTYRSEAVASRIGQLLLIDALFVGVYLKDPARFAAAQTRTRQAVSDVRP